MPYSNAIGAVPGDLRGIIEYLGDEEHPHHEEYRITPLDVFGVKSPVDFMSYALRGFSTNMSKKAGRPPQNAATWFVIRMPDGTWLTDDERSAYQVAAREEAGCGESVVGIMNTHRNRLTGAEDINLLAAAFTARGELVRDRNRNPIRSLRRRMDEVTAALNHERHLKGVPLIQTMQEVQASNRAKYDAFDVVELLANIPKPPQTIKELKICVSTIGGEVTRFNSEEDRISIKFNGRKKRFSISTLLEDIRRAVLRLISQRKEKLKKGEIVEQDENIS